MCVSDSHYDGNWNKRKSRIWKPSFCSCVLKLGAALKFSSSSSSLPWYSPCCPYSSSSAWLSHPPLSLNNFSSRNSITLLQMSNSKTHWPYLSFLLDLVFTTAITSASLASSPPLRSPLPTLVLLLIFWYIGDFIVFISVFIVDMHETEIDSHLMKQLLLSPYLLNYFVQLVVNLWVLGKQLRNWSEMNIKVRRESFKLILL